MKPLDDIARLRNEYEDRKRRFAESDVYSLFNPANLFIVQQRQREILARLGFRRQALHAQVLGFVHPVTKARLSFQSALPSDMQELFSALGV